MNPERIYVAYRAPVQVTVNLRTGRVDSVVVLDEEAEPDTNGHLADADTDATLTAHHPAVGRAYDIADDADWPTWNIGR